MEKATKRNGNDFPLADRPPTNGIMATGTQEKTTPPSAISSFTVAEAQRTLRDYREKIGLYPELSRVFSEIEAAARNGLSEIIYEFPDDCQCADRAVSHLKSTGYFVDRMNSIASTGRARIRIYGWGP